MKQSGFYGLQHLEGAALLEMNLAEKALDDGKLEIAWDYLKKTLNRLPGSGLDDQLHHLPLSVTLLYSDLCFYLQKDVTDLEPYLKRALTAAETLGDRRSRALTLLHLGRLHYFQKSNRKAFLFFEEGRTAVDDLGDEDILSQASALLGFYFQVRGLFLDALPHFERSTRNWESGRNRSVFDPLGPTSLVYCYAFLGYYHRAMGELDYYRRFAIERADETNAATMHAMMGMILLMSNKRGAAFRELTGALQEAKRVEDIVGQHFASGCLSYHELLEGNLIESRKLLLDFKRHAKKTGLNRLYELPFTIEHIFELDRRGLNNVAALDYAKEIKRCLQGHNIHLQGVAYRLMALDAKSRGADPAAIEEMLKKSETTLSRAGDPIQQAKTWVELAYLSLKKNDKAAARGYAQNAWRGCCGPGNLTGNLIFPDALRPLLGTTRLDSANREKSLELTEKFILMIEELAPSDDLDDLMTKVIRATNRFFGAERGGFFWFSGEVENERPSVQGTHNLTQQEIYQEDFKPGLQLIRKAFLEKKFQIRKLEFKKGPSTRARAIMCLPFEIWDGNYGVLYHDNSFFTDCFGFIERTMLARLVGALSAYVQSIYKFSNRLKESSSEDKLSYSRIRKDVLITDDPEMKQTVEMVDRVAASGSTILIMGETGVGKELVARRIHEMSERKNGPFVIIDATTIPENLFESEMFGHQRGAFTGADRAKAGRLELAHNGTLFIDEISEIPKHLQAKLLRVLQEKTLVRLGSNRTISSNFRLVAATNKDLATEVSAGRFREDLFYRLNVVPITLPPLRQRKEDIPLLARHFAAKYASEYNCPEPNLTAKNERMLSSYHWPGNIRELQNIMERTVILSTSEKLFLDLPAGKPIDVQELFGDDPSMDELQRRYIRHAIEKTGGKISGPGGAAELLNMNRSTLIKRMKKLGISKPDRFLP